MHNREQIDFLPNNRANIFTFKKIAPTIIVLIILLGIAYTTRAVISSNDIAQQFGDTTVFEQLKHLVSSEDRKIAGEEDNRINILLLGIGGKNHDGGQLTDTIIVASIDPEQNKMGLLSIPRDLVVPIKGVGWQKINAAHAYGIAMDEYERPKAGSQLSVKTVEAITGIKMHYYFKLDFAGFEKIVNALGGIRVEVPISFTDYEYPDENYGYQEVHFSEGWQNLNGEDALKYVRSRHGSAGEGSDFARAKRQQQILSALQARALALSTLLNPNKIISVAEIIGDHIETNMEIWELFRLYNMGHEINIQNIDQVVLNTSEQGLLAIDQDEDGAYLLRPRIGYGNFSEIKLAAENLIQQTNQNAIKQAPESENRLRVVVQNGTMHQGLAAATADILKGLSFNIMNISNAKQKGYEKTVIYQLSGNVMADDMQIIRQTLKANIAPSIPEFLDLPDADVLIIVGEDNV